MIILYNPTVNVVADYSRVFQMKIVIQWRHCYLKYINMQGTSMLWTISCLTRLALSCQSHMFQQNNNSAFLHTSCINFQKQCLNFNTY